MILRNPILLLPKYIEEDNKIWKIIQEIKISRKIIKLICTVKFIGRIKTIKTGKYF
jgi:hypothetical protein